MSRLLVIVLSVFIFTTSNADTTRFKDKFFNSIETLLNDNFEDTDFSIKSKEGNKPEIGILTFKPLIDSDDGLTFFQGSFFMHDGDRETLNLGYGKRFFNLDKSFLYGLNLFYDHELDYDHQRASVGGEIKSSILELNTNHYFAISNETTGKNNIKEEVADGYDFELGAHVPYVPSAKIFAKFFEYEITGGSDFEGIEYTSSVDIPNSGLNVEVGFKDYGNKSYEDQWFVNLTFNFSSINKNTNFIREDGFERG